MMTARCRHHLKQIGSRRKVFEPPAAIGLFIQPQRIVRRVDIDAQDNAPTLIVEMLNVYSISFLQHSVLKSGEVVCQWFSRRSSGEGPFAYYFGVTMRHRLRSRLGSEGMQ